MDAVNNKVLKMYIIGSAEGAFAASEALQSMKSLLHMSTRSEITECMDVSTPFSCRTIRHNVPFQHGIPKKNRVSRNLEEHEK